MAFEKNTTYTQMTKQSVWKHISMADMFFFWLKYTFELYFK